MGLKSPFAPTIEWHKHQPPETWTDLLGGVGFRATRVRWSSFNKLRSPGRYLLGNRWASYCLHSHFALYLEKPVDA
jgi:hypothetical protein